MGQAERQGLGSHRRRVGLRRGEGGIRVQAAAAQGHRHGEAAKGKGQGDGGSRATAFAHFISLFSALLLILFLALSLSLAEAHRRLTGDERADDDVRDNRLSGLLRQEEDGGDWHALGRAAARVI